MSVALTANPHWASHQMHRGRQNRGPTGIRTQDLSLTVRALCKLSYRDIWSSFDTFHVPARNNGGTTRHDFLMLVATLSHKMSQGRKISRPDRGLNQGSLVYRRNHFASWATETLGRLLTFFIPLLCYIRPPPRICSEQRRNNETCTFWCSLP